MKTSFNISLVQVEKYIVSKHNIYTKLFHHHSVFHYCHFGVNNLCILVLLIKNDPIVGFEAKGRPPKDVDEFGEMEEKILNVFKMPNFMMRFRVV